jgi:hypothetical protein
LAFPAHLPGPSAGRARAAGDWPEAFAGGRFC